MTQHAMMKQIKQVLVEEAQTDVVGLWAVLWEVKQEMPTLTADEARVATLEVVKGVLEHEEVIPGEFKDEREETTAFVPWQMSVVDTLKRIDREWGELGREPNLGDIVWFVSARLLPLTIRKDPLGKGWKP